MAHAESTTIIDRPIGIVFNFVSDGMNNPLWRPTVTDIQKIPGKNAAYKQGVKGPGGSRIDADYQIVESVPDRLIKFQVISGPARPTGMYRFETVGSSTQVTLILDLKPKGLQKLMDGMITSTMKSEVAMLSNLKRYLESH
jgi:uncharacterized membrane protein